MFPIHLFGEVQCGFSLSFHILTKNYFYTGNGKSRNNSSVFLRQFSPKILVRITVLIEIFITITKNNIYGNLFWLLPNTLYICIVIVQISSTMVAANILNFASPRNDFSKKELFTYSKGINPGETSSPISIQLYCLVDRGELVRVNRGIYVLPGNAKKNFSISPSEELNAIYKQISIHFPFIDFCIR